MFSVPLAERKKALTISEKISTSSRFFWEFWFWEVFPIPDHHIFIWSDIEECDIRKEWWIGYFSGGFYRTGSIYIEWNWVTQVYLSSTKSRDVSATDSEESAYNWRERSDIPTRTDRETDIEKWRNKCMNHNIWYRYRTCREIKHSAFSSEIVCSLSVDMEGTIFRWSLRGECREISREFIRWSHLESIEGCTFYISAEIERCTRPIYIHGESISFRTGIEEWYELGAISSRYEYASSRERVECPSMSHLLDTQSLPEFSDHIETRHADRLIYEIEHVLFEFRIGRSTRMIEESWRISPSEFLILDESPFAKYIVVSKIQ